MLLGGLVLGLTLGLLIGWVWWPVDWEGNAPPPATTATGLSTEAKAAYLASVADAYVAYNNPEAATLATQRLAALEEADIQAAFNEAIAYYSTQPDANLRINNLSQLASIAGIPVTLENLPAPLQADAGESADATAPATGDASPATAADGGGGWGAWLAIFGFAVVMVGGGLYVLYRVSQQRQLDAGGEGGEEEVGGFADEPIADDDRGGAAFTRDNLAPPPRNRTAQPNPPPAPARARPLPGTAVPAAQPKSPHGFETDPDEFEDGVGGQDHVLDYGVVQEPERSDPNGEATTTATQSTLKPEDGQDGATAETGSQRPAVTGTAPSSTIPSIVPSRYDRYPVLDRYPVTYHVGMVDFDMTRNVERPDGAGYIGEYGIGISDRNGLLNNNLEQVIALEVYLFDKTDETPMVTVTRALLSEYAHDHLYTAYARETQGGDPITAQPATRFQLEAKKLILDCTVTSVTYSDKGVYQEVAVDMVLRQKR